MRIWANVHYYVLPIAGWIASLTAAFVALKVVFPA